MSIILLGAEMNAELELQTAVDTTTGRPKPWVSEEPLLPTMSQEDLKATDVHHPEGLTSPSLTRRQRELFVGNYSVRRPYETLRTAALSR
jgi:hypothetical protein